MLMCRNSPMELTLDQKGSKCTAVAKNTRNPIFNEIFTFVVTSEQTNFVQLRWVMQTWILRIVSICDHWVKVGLSGRQYALSKIYLPIHQETIAKCSMKRLFFFYCWYTDIFVIALKLFCILAAYGDILNRWLQSRFWMITFFAARYLAPLVFSGFAMNCGAIWMSHWVSLGKLK